MAKETKIIEVAPSAVDKAIETWGSFGWELMGQPQRIFNKTVRDGDSRTDSDGNTRTQVITETIDYFTITFQRDKSMPNYARLVELENVYNTSQPVSPDSPTLFGCLWMVLILVGLFAFIVPGILIIIWRIIRYKKLKKIYEEEFSAYMEKEKIWKQNKENAISEAKSLC